MKVAILWLINEKGQIILARRAHHMDSDAGVWGPSVSGKIEDSETPIEAVIRETQEELKITASQVTPLFLHQETHNHKDGQKREFDIFYAKVNSDISRILTLEPDEVDEVRWFVLSEIQNLVDKKSNNLIISENTILWNSLLNNLKVIIDSSKLSVSK